MTSNLTDAINHYIEEPTELLVLENIRIGRMKLGRMVIRGRWAGYNALDVIGSAFEKTARVRSGKHGTRHLLHPKLIEAGFLEFISDMRRCDHPRLFPHLSAGVSIKTGETNARYSQGVLNQFSNYLKDLGFPKGIGFHAFRHTLKEAWRPTTPHGREGCILAPCKA